MQLASINEGRYRSEDGKIKGRMASSWLGRDYLEKLRIILALMWRKKMEAMNESERTRTMKGSILKPGESSV